MEDLRLQLKVMRQDVRLLQKTAADIVRARRNAELKIKEYVLSSHLCVIFLHNVDVSLHDRQVCCLLKFSSSVLTVPN